MRQAQYSNCLRRVRAQDDIIQSKDKELDDLLSDYNSLYNKYLNTKVWASLSHEERAKQSIELIDPQLYGSSLYRIYLCLRVQNIITDIKVYPVDLDSYHLWFNESVAPHIRANSGHSNWHMHEDVNYSTLSFTDLERIVDRSWVPNLPYKVDITDCDFFVRSFKDELELDYGVNAGAMVTSQYYDYSQQSVIAHKIMSVYCSDIPAVVDITRTREVYPHDGTNIPDKVKPSNWMEYYG